MAGLGLVLGRVIVRVLVVLLGLVLMFRTSTDYLLPIT